MVRIYFLQQIHFNVKDSLEQTVSLYRGLTVINNFIQISKVRSVSKQCFAAPDPVLQCLPMSHI